MWDAVAEALKRGDFAVAFGVALLAAIVVLGLVVRTLWNMNQSLHRHIAEQEAKCRKELEGIHEKRIEEAKDVTDKIVNYSEELHRAMDRLSSSMETLIELQRNRR